MKVTYLEGNLVEDLISNKYGAYAHGCNCFHTMGAGIAKSINEATEGLALETDMQTAYGDINKLGSFSVFEYDLMTIFNLYTQYTYGKFSGVKVHWESVERALSNAILYAYYSNHSYLAIPFIGCGLAGGNVLDFQEIIDNLKNRFSGIEDFELVIISYK